MRQVRAVLLTGYLEVAAFVGLDGRAQLRRAGIAPGMLGHPEDRLSAAAVIQLLERSAKDSHCDHFGVLMAEARSFASLGPVSLLLEHLPNVREAVRAAIVFQRQLNDVTSISLEETGDTSLIRFDLATGYWGAQISDLMMGIAYRVLTGASGNRWRPDAVHLMRPAPADPAPWRRFFGLPIDFASSWNGLSRTPEALSIPNPLADEAMARNARHLLEMVPQADAAGRFADSVQRVITLLLPSGGASLESAAAQLALSPRTLQRRLAAEGRSFAELLEVTRRALAGAYLATADLPVTSVATMLGYNSVSAFSRWFSGAFGVSPRVWRARQAQAGPPDGPPPLWRR
jgi:AraC-like DNA-binding protein